MASAATRELTEGKALPLLLRFSIPLFLGGILQQFYQLTDSAIVSNFLGVDMLAAVGASTSIVFLIIGFCNGCGAGMAIPVAQAFGARDYAGVRKYTFNALYVAGALSIFIAAVSVLMCGNILRWINIPEEIFRGSYLYLSIILAGIPCTFFYNLSANILRALGDSRTPFLFLVFSTVLNIILDLCFILLFKWGVAGAALATVLSQGIAAVLSLRFLLKNYDVMKDSPEDRRFDAKAALRAISIGAPMGFQFSITAIGSIMIQSANNSLGTVYVAAFAAGMRIKMFFMCLIDSLGLAMATYAGQNIGAGRPDRILEGIKAAFLMVTLYCIFCLALIWPLSEPLTRIFVDASQREIIDACILYIRACVCFFILLGSLSIFRNVIQGLGYTNFAMWSGVMEMIARTALALLLVRSYGFRAVSLNDGIAWIAANIFLIPAFIYVFRRVKKDKKARTA